VVSSGLPLSVAIRAHENLGFFDMIAGSCEAETPSISEVIVAVRAIEDWARRWAEAVTGQMPDASKLDAIREGWLAGAGLQALSVVEPDAREISKELYGYQLPWIIHAAAQQLRGNGQPERAAALARLALLVELGLPSEKAARIFLAGIRSRAAAVEIASLGIDFGSTIAEIGRNLRDQEIVDALRMLVSPEAAEWLDLIAAESSRRQRVPVPQFPTFNLPGSDSATVLHARRLGERVFLSSTDGATRIEVVATPELPFEKVADDPRIAFMRTDQDWIINVRDPRLQRPQED
jgi:hypothetical protein